MAAVSGATLGSSVPDDLPDLVRRAFACFGNGILITEVFVHFDVPDGGSRWVIIANSMMNGKWI